MKSWIATHRGACFGLAAATAFGVSAPLAKRLLDDVRPQMLAGLLYVGAFLALLLAGRRSPREARLRRADAPRMTLMVATGGVAAPVLLLLGLERMTGVAGSLMLNLEGPLTILVGVALFHEHLPRMALAGAAAIFAGAVVLGIGAGTVQADWIGMLLVGGACAGWAIDNNLTQALTVRDPLSIVRVKAGVAGAVNVACALALGEHVPAVEVFAAVLLLGAVSYGLSVYLDARALRELGAAREAMFFAVAPFVGAALFAPLVLPEAFTRQDLVAGMFMAAGVVVLLLDRHHHLHRHEPMDHDHVHVHDEHHAHVDDHDLDSGLEPHAHHHHHDEMVHAHPHVSDVHHRHSH